jgi:hypothetical protein
MHNKYFTFLLLDRCHLAWEKPLLGLVLTAGELLCRRRATVRVRRRRAAALSCRRASLLARAAATLACSPALSASAVAEPLHSPAAVLACSPALQPRFPASLRCRRLMWCGQMLGCTFNNSVGQGIKQVGLASGSISFFFGTDLAGQ